MTPAQSDEVILSLDQEELLFILGVTVVWAATLLWHDHMGNRESIPGLGQTVTMFEHFSVLLTNSHCGAILN